MKKVGNLVKKIARAYFRACAESNAWMCTGCAYPVFYDRA